jgi:hypothetical protein
MKEGENGLETLGFNSPSHNPENELPQWQQKIALRAENKALPDNESIWARMAFFAHLRNFLQVLDLLIFRQ